MCRPRTTGSSAIWRCTSGSAARVDRTPGARHGLRRGVRLGGALADGRLGRRRRREPGGARARHASATSARTCGSSAGWSRTSGSPATFDAVVFLQTIEHVQEPAAVLEHFRRLLAPGGIAYVSTPNVLTLAPAGAEKSGQPVARPRVPGRGVRHAVPIGVRPGRAAGPVPRPQAARARARVVGSGGTRSTPGCGSRSRSTTGSRRRSARATSRCAPAASTARSTSWRFARPTSKRRKTTESDCARYQPD